MAGMNFLMKYSEKHEQPVKENLQTASGVVEESVESIKTIAAYNA